MTASTALDDILKRAGLTEEQCRMAGVRPPTGPTNPQPASAPSMGLAPETAEFVTNFFKGTKHQVELRALPCKKRAFTRDLKQIGEFIKHHISKDNIYFGVATREGSGGTKGHCRDIPALWADVDFKDTPEGEFEQKLADFELPPSVMVASGGGLHLHWLLKTPVSANNPQIEPILRGLALALGGDLAAAETARVLRLPGTLNYKYSPPRKVELRASPAEWERRYFLEDFLPFADSRSNHATSAPVAADGKIHEGRRNAHLTSLAGSMRRRGMSQSAIEAALQKENQERCDPPLPEIEVRQIAQSVGKYQPGVKTELVNPWSAVEGIDTFLENGDDEAQFLDPEKRILARSSVTEIFAPRGLGKSLYALWLAVLLAQSRLRVLYIDRDNPRHVVRNRLRGFGATGELKNLKIISREKCPPLTNAAAWALFPYAEYDVVMLDSFDSAAEGIGEQDSAKPSRAIAPVLDIARRENGPAVLILGNTIKSAAHSRGSGVVEDRADIVFEVRDATGFHFTGSKSSWIEELPTGGAEAWAGRASRRKQREKFRLAFIASKFRIGTEPEPFALEIDLTTEPWGVRDATDDVDHEGAAAREQGMRERSETRAKASDTLATEILRRAEASEPPMLKDRDAIRFLMDRLNLTRNLSREVINNPGERWILERIKGEKGHPIGLLPPRIKREDGGNTPSLGPAKTLGETEADFRRVHEQATAEIDPSQTLENGGAKDSRISATNTTFLPGDSEKEAVKPPVLEGQI